MHKLAMHELCDEMPVFISAPTLLLAYGVFVGAGVSVRIAVLAGGTGDGVAVGLEMSVAVAAA